MSEKFFSFLVKAFTTLATTLSSHLGDRSQYIGASDVVGCGRKAALKRLSPATSPIKISSQMVMALGHAIEDLLAKVFTAGGLSFDREVEMIHPEYPWLKCHEDFRFISNGGRRHHITEVKSTVGLPPVDGWDPKKSSWTAQNLFQQGLHRLNLPEINVTGEVLAFDRASGELAQYPVEFDQNVFDVLVEKAKGIWAAVKGEGPIPGPEPGLLCGFCDYQSECPAHQRSREELPEEISEIARLFAHHKRNHAMLGGVVDGLKEMLMDYAGGRRLKGVTPDGLVVNVSPQAGKISINGEKLRALAPELYQECSKMGKGFVKVEVKPLPEPKAAAS